MAKTSNLSELSFVNNRGETVAMSEFAGKPVLIVNTASKCGLTPQYEGLQKLHDEFSDKGLVVLGFPCDQFAHQEPGNDTDIEQFCSLNYGVTFGLSTKVDVNGKSTHPVVEFCKQKAGGLLGSSIKWNFTQFLVSPDGSSVKRYAPTVLPADIREDIQKVLV